MRICGVLKFTDPDPTTELDGSSSTLFFSGFQGAKKITVNIFTFTYCVYIYDSL